MPVNIKSVGEIAHYDHNYQLDIKSVLKEVIEFKPMCKKDLTYIKEFCLTHMNVDNFYLILYSLFHNWNIAKYDKIYCNLERVYNNDQFVMGIAMIKKEAIRQGKFLNDDKRQERARKKLQSYGFYQ